MSKVQKQERKPPLRLKTANGFCRISVYDEEPKRGDVVVYISRGEYGIGVWLDGAICTGRGKPLRVGKSRELVGVVRDIER